MVSVIAGGMGTRLQGEWGPESRGGMGTRGQEEWEAEARGEWGPEARGLCMHIR